MTITQKLARDSSSLSTEWAERNLQILYWRLITKADFKIDDTLDITTVVCPTTFVKAKVALEELDDGQILSIRMNDGEPVQNVPRSIKEEGHKILKLIDNEDGTYDLIVQKVGD